MKLVYCRGGDPKAQIFTNKEWLYGIRSDYVPYGSVYMLDVKYHAGESVWPAHVAQALTLRPALTMIPDYERPEQLPALMAMHETLVSAGLQTFWCPKFEGALKDIPSYVVLAISVPTRYGGWLPMPADVSGRRLHLLGGHPDHQHYLRYRVYTESDVISADGNVAGLKAYLGQSWHESGYWQQHGPNEYTNDALMMMSAQTIPHYMACERVIYNMRRMQLIQRQFFQQQELAM